MGRCRIGPLQVLLYFFDYAVRSPPQPPSLVFPCYLQPFLKAARSPNPTEHHHDSGKDFYRWERDLSACDELTGDHIGKAVYSSFAPCPALRAPLCNPPLPKAVREMLLTPPGTRDVPEPAKFGKQLSWGLSTATQREQRVQQQVGFWRLMTLTQGPKGSRTVKR